MKMMKSASQMAAIVAIVMVSAGCATSERQDASTRVITISRDSFQGEWPFTVDSGTLRCEQPQSVVFSTEGSDYGVNGSAMDAGYQEAQPIWRRATGGGGPRVSIDDVIDRGLELCR